MYSNSKKHEGFTLIELIISVAVIVVFVTGVYGIVTFSMKNNKDAEIKQEAAMYGQQIFEDFKSSQVTKTIYGNELKLSNGSSELFDLIGHTTTTTTTTTGASVIYKESSIDLGNRYTADISVNANSSGLGTALNQKIQNSNTENEINLIKSNNQVEINSSEGKQPISVSSVDNKIILVVYVSTVDDSKKNVVIKDATGAEVFNENFQPETNKKDLIINMDFEQYEISSQEEEEIEVKVWNKDVDNISIVSHEKPENLYLSLKQYGSGQFTYYDGTNSKDLYDINVVIKRDEKTVFEGTSSQNIQVNKE